MGNYSKFPSNENEEIICCREYNRSVRSTETELEEYFNETEKILESFVYTADFLKDLRESRKDHLLEFLLGCNELAEDMAASLIVVYQKDNNRFCASVVCDKPVFRALEIEILMRLCAFTNQIEFFNSPLPDYSGSVVDFFFDISDKSLSLMELLDMATNSFDIDGRA